MRPPHRCCQFTAPGWVLTHLTFEGAVCGEVFAGRNAGQPLVGAVVAVGLNRPILEKRQAGVVHEDLDACFGRCRQRRGLGSTVPDGNCERRALLSYRLLNQLDHVRTDVVVVRQRDPGVLAARSLDQRTREVRAVLYNSEERVCATDGADVHSASAGSFAARSWQLGLLQPERRSSAISCEPLLQPLFFAGAASSAGAAAFFVEPDRCRCHHGQKQPPTALSRYNQH